MNLSNDINGTDRDATMKVYRRLRRIAIVFLAAFPAMVLPQDAGAQAVVVPGVINPALRLEAPDLRGVATLKFLTADDYPPFNVATKDGALAGYNVDLARALCEELKVACTIQARRFATLVDALAAGAGDAIVAALPPGRDPRLAFSIPYLPTPARFATKAKTDLVVTPEGLAGRAVGVVQDGAHAAFLERFFPQALAKPYATLADLETALAGGEVDAAFADAADLAFWMNGAKAAGCCAFSGGPFVDRRFFGSGLAIAVRAGDERLRRAFDWALTRVSARGVLTDLYLRYFPVAFY